MRTLNRTTEEECPDCSGFHRCDYHEGMRHGRQEATCDCLCCRIRPYIKKIGAVAGSALMVGMTFGSAGDVSRRSDSE